MVIRKMAYNYLNKESYTQDKDKMDYFTQLNLDSQIKRINNGKASMIIIDGAMGSGKTTLAIHMAKYFSEKYSKKEFKIRDQLALGSSDFADKLLNAFEKKYNCIIYDEAGDYSKRSSLSKTNRALTRIFEQYRGLKILIIVCLPSIGTLDQSLFLQQVPRFGIHIIDRNSEKAYFKGYDLQQMCYIRHKMKTEILPSFVYNYAMWRWNGWFKNLDKEESDELDQISTEAKVKNMKKSKDILDDEEDTWTNRKHKNQEKYSES